MYALVQVLCVLCALISLVQCLDPGQQSAYRVFTGQNIIMLRRFLDKEDKRRRDAEAQNIPFVEHSDDKLDIH